jgi:DnaK suppressor protein
MQPWYYLDHPNPRADLTTKGSPRTIWEGQLMMRTAVKSTKKVYRTLLLKKRDEILAATRSEPEALSVSVQSPDAVEFAVRTVEQDVTVVTANLRSGMLKEIERALKRCAGGTYGVCEACSEEISPNRLKAIPWARYCLTCQELRSRN